MTRFMLIFNNFIIYKIKKLKTSFKITIKMLLHYV